MKYSSTAVQVEIYLKPDCEHRYVGKGEKAWVMI